MTIGPAVARSTLVLALLLPAAAQAQPARWQVGTMPTFSSGTYGTGERTVIVQTAFTARRLFDSGDVTLVAPITCLQGDGSVTLAAGSPVRTGAAPTAPPTTRPADASGGTSRDTRESNDRTTVTETTAAAGSETRSRTSRCGPGDLVIRGRYYVIDEHGQVPTIALRGHVKVPTASAVDGLGTGRMDHGVGIEISRTLGSAVVAMVDAGYTFMGDPASAPLEDRWWYGVGLARRLSARVDVSAFVEGQSAVVPGLAMARNLLGVVNLTASAGWRVQVAAEVGLSDGAPDHGLSLGASRRF